MQKTLNIEIGHTNYNDPNYLICIFKNSNGEIVSYFEAKFTERFYDMVCNKINSYVQENKMEAPVSGKKFLFPFIVIVGVKNYFTFFDINSKRKKYEVFPVTNNVIILGITEKLMKSWSLKDVDM